METRWQHAIVNRQFRPFAYGRGRCDRIDVTILAAGRSFHRWCGLAPDHNPPSLAHSGHGNWRVCSPERKL